MLNIKYSIQYSKIIPVLNEKLKFIELDGILHIVYFL